MSSAVPYYLLTAFTSSRNGGNPAAVAFLDTNASTEALMSIAKNLNQPVTSFVSPTFLPSKNEKTAAFDIRYFAPSNFELPLCGHGTLAAAKAVFERPGLVANDVKVIEFHTQTLGTMAAKRHENGMVEIQLPSAEIEEVDPEERASLVAMVNEAFGSEVDIKHIARGINAFAHCVLIELDEKEDLGNCSVKANMLLHNNYYINIITTASSTGKEAFVSRMFSPKVLIDGEDHVCGTAHCVMTPYWSKKLGIPAGQTVKAKQVSPRGGDLTLIWEAEEDLLRLMGQVVVLAKGDLII